MTFADCELDDIGVDPPGVLSDHSLIACRVPAAVDPQPSTVRLVRVWRQFDRDDLQRALEDIVLCQPVPDDANVDDLFSAYNSVLRDTSDRFAPPQSIQRRADRRAPWFDADCLSQSTQRLSRL